MNSNNFNKLKLFLRNKLNIFKNKFSSNNNTSKYMSPNDKLLNDKPSSGTLSTINNNIPTTPDEFITIGNTGRHGIDGKYKVSSEKITEPYTSSFNNTISIDNFSKYQINVVSSVLNNIIDTICINENKSKKIEYKKSHFEYYNTQLNYTQLVTKLDPNHYNQLKNIITNILYCNSQFLCGLYSVKLYNSDLINSYTRYGVFQTENFIIKSDDTFDIFTPEIEIVKAIGSGIVLPYNIVTPYFIYCTTSNTNGVNTTMNFSIQPRIKNSLPLYKWIHLAASKKQPVEYIINMCITICKSILYIHSHELVHGDIKPDNILVDINTNKPYIIDFGLSGLHELSDGSGGTRPFCCPETKNIFDNSKNIYHWIKNSKHNDLWSIAFIFAAILIFKGVYNNYNEYPANYFNHYGYVTLHYLLRIPVKFRNAFIYVLSEKSCIDLTNFISILEQSLISE